MATKPTIKRPDGEADDWGIGAVADGHIVMLSPEQVAVAQADKKAERELDAEAELTPDETEQAIAAGLLAADE